MMRKIAKFEKKYWEKNQKATVNIVQACKVVQTVYDCFDASVGSCL